MNIGKIVESLAISTASSFPIAASLATGWSEYKNHKQTENIKEMLNSYFKRLNQLENKVDATYLASEESKRIIEKTLNLGKNETIKDKRDMFIQFLANSSSKELAQDLQKDIVLDTINKMTILQEKILVYITAELIYTRGSDNVLLGSNYNPDLSNKPVFGYILESNIIINFSSQCDRLNIEALLNYMKAIGIVEGHGERGWTQIGGKTGIKGYRPTILGIKTLEYLDKPIHLFPELPIEFRTKLNKK